MHRDARCTQCDRGGGHRSFELGVTLAARVLQSVTITFGLVTIPVKMYAATDPKGSVHFNYLHKWQPGDPAVPLYRRRQGRSA
jgi:hypothetical protein